MLDVILEDIKKILDDYHNLTGFPISLYDENHNAIYHAAGMSPYCMALRKYPELKQKCKVCEAKGKEICDSKRKTHIFRCHSGQMEVHLPICENNVIIGYILSGQILCNEYYDYAKNKAIEYQKLCNITDNRFLNLFENIPVVDNKFLISSINMIEMCASYLYLSKTIKKKSYVISQQLKDYIDNHLTEDLSVKFLCDKLYISKTKLYNLSMNIFGMGCSEYITFKRIEKAKQLLETTEKNIYTIAEESGFKDTNYFIRTFKKLEGITPNKYKQSKRA